MNTNEQLLWGLQQAALGTMREVARLMRQIEERETDPSVRWQLLRQALHNVGATCEVGR